MCARVAASLAIVAVLLLSPSAHADWTVKRQGDESLFRQAAQSLTQHPDDREVARRLVRLGQGRRLTALLADLRSRAESEPRRYESIEAYAQLLLGAGRALEAAPRFADAAALRPGTWPPLEGRARALAAAGDRTAAIAAYETALVVAREAALTRRLLTAALALCTTPADSEREVALRRRLLALAPSDAEAERLADALERAGKPGEAADRLESRLPARAATDSGAGFRLTLRAAALRSAAGDDARAENLVESLLDALPRSRPERRREAWERAIEIAHHRDALPALAARLEGSLEPGLPEWEALARVRDETGDLDGALMASRRASRLAPRDLDLRRRTLALLERLGRETDVEAAYEEIARLAPGDARFALELIERKFRRGERDQARARFDAARRRLARHPEALAALADLAARWSEDARALSTWQELRRRYPRDETALRGLGDAYLAAGRKAEALRTWRTLAATGGDRAEAAARLAEVLFERDLLDEAAVEARRAVALGPADARHHRLLALVLERQHHVDEALRAWDAVLSTSTGADRAGERHEARSHMLSLFMRSGQGHLDEYLSRLEAGFRDHPNDRENALALAEARVRTNNLKRAITVLRGVVDRDPGDADTTVALVRFLRQDRQIDEAVRRLEELARRVPARAREVHVQLADIELARYDDRRALAHAQQAASLSPNDPQALGRIAEVEERAGNVDEALATYRKVVAFGGPPQAGFSLARLLVRRGEARQAAEVLRRVIRTAGDEETVADAARRAIDLEEYLGTLPDLERALAGLTTGAGTGAAQRRALVEVYRRTVPSLYRAAGHDDAAAAELARLAQHGLRPLLEVLTDPDVEPDRGLVEVLGMLGNGDAAPALSRLVGPPSTSATEPTAATAGATRKGPIGAIELRLAAVVALGRLGDARGRDAIAEAAFTPDAALRAAAVWALGRMGGVGAAETLVKLSEDPTRADVSALACLGLGRLHDRRAGAHLTAMASASGRDPLVRRAAALALGLSGDPDAMSPLLALLDAGDPALAHAAAAGLGLLHDRRVVAPLLERALLGRGAAAAASLAALDRAAAEAPAPDEGRAIEAGRLDAEALLAALTVAPAHTDLTSLWSTRAAEMTEALGTALARHRDVRVRALEALDARDDGLGLGALASTAPLSPAGAAALRGMAEALRERIVALLDDPDPETRRLALRVAAKIDDARVTPARVAAAADGGGDLARAAVFATARLTPLRSAWAAAVVDAMRPLLARDDGERRAAALGVLGAVGSPARPTIELALADADPFVRTAAVEALALLPDATDALASAATDTRAAVRAAAARALRGRAEPVAVTARARLAADPVALVRRAAAGD